jgi:DNA polymerase
MTDLSIDFESRSAKDLRKCSVYPYAAHPTTDLWCMAWSFEEEEDVYIWRPGMPLDPRIVQQAKSGMLRAWNAAFERIMWREIMVKRYGAPVIDDAQWVCTASEGSAMALPRSLDNAAAVLGVSQQKDEKGKRLMLQMAKPRKPRKGEVVQPGQLLWWDDEERRSRLDAYCMQDVRTEKAAKKAILRLNTLETQIYQLDQRINDRGVYIDIPLVEAAQRIVDEGQRRAGHELCVLTDGAVTSVTNHADLTAWLVGRGVETEGVSKPVVAELLETDIDDESREALEIRQDAGKSSLAKLKSFMAVVSADFRARGLHVYHAASTGRWGGKHIQTQNLPRGTVAAIERYIDAVLRGDYDGIDILEHPLVVIVSMLRSMVRAAPDHDLIAGDYSAVEARVLNWLAGQDDVLALFRAMDRGDKSRHPYKVMAVKMGRARTTADVKKPSEDYQAGKAAELGCGFQMGAEKFVRAAWEVYQVRVTDEQAVVAVKAYRESHDKVVELWWDTERAVKQAIATPGAKFTFGAGGKLAAIVLGSYLYIVLPSRRALVYAGPRVFDTETSWGAIKPTIHYKGVNPHPAAHGSWDTLRTYGGHLVENIVQAVARDLLAEAMLRLEARGYPPVMHCHDEAVAEVPKGFGSQQEFEGIMAELPSWAAGLPLAVESWRGERYRK